MDRSKKIKKDREECVLATKQLCIQNNIEYNELLKKKRDRDLVDIRRVIIYYLRELKFSFPTIGYALNKNYATVIYHCNTAKNYLAYDKQFKKLYENFTKNDNWENKTVNLLKDNDDNIIGLFDYDSNAYYKVTK